MRDPLFCTYYDRLQSDKDYRREAETILALCKAHSATDLQRILDVGCGTGTHALIFAGKGYEVLAVDPDQDMIRLAKEKREALKDIRIEFLCSDVDKVPDSGFHLAVSLFNVVNYIRSVRELLGFFRAVHKRLGQGGLFIFDAWNGVAALRDPPGEKKRHICSGGETIRCRVESDTDVFGQKTLLRYAVEVVGPEIHREFEHEIEHILWTPKCLRDLLDMARLDTLKVLPFMQQRRDAGAEDWKITFVTRKR